MSILEQLILSLLTCVSLQCEMCWCDVFPDTLISSTTPTVPEEASVLVMPGKAEVEKVSSGSVDGGNGNRGGRDESLQTNCTGDASCVLHGPNFKCIDYGALYNPGEKYKVCDCIKPSSRPSKSSSETACACITPSGKELVKFKLDKDGECRLAKGELCPILGSEPGGNGTVVPEEECLKYKEKLKCEALTGSLMWGICGTDGGSRDFGRTLLVLSLALFLLLFRFGMT